MVYGIGSRSQKDIPTVGNRDLKSKNKGTKTDNFDRPVVTSVRNWHMRRTRDYNDTKHQSAKFAIYGNHIQITITGHARNSLGRKMNEQKRRHHPPRLNSAICKQKRQPLQRTRKNRKSRQLWKKCFESFMELAPTTKNQ